MDQFKLDIEGLSCIRGERTLFENLNFSLLPQQCLHVTGANGSGKTSLLRQICGLGRSGVGTILWNQETISQNSEFHRALIYIGHKEGLKNELTATENLEFYQSLDGTPDAAQVDKVMAQLNILECAELPAFQLSFGQRRRLAFARLLLGEKPIWILDEPFTGIDAQGRALIESLCVTHLQSGGSIILTHHQSLNDSSLSSYLQELRL